MELYGGLKAPYMNQRQEKKIKWNSCGETALELLKSFNYFLHMKQEVGDNPDTLGKTNVKLAGNPVPTNQNTGIQKFQNK